MLELGCDLVFPNSSVTLACETRGLAKQLPPALCLQPTSTAAPSLRSYLHVQPRHLPAQTQPSQHPTSWDMGVHKIDVEIRLWVFVLWIDACACVLIRRRRTRCWSEIKLSQCSRTATALTRRFTPHPMQSKK